jgi:hypothetical protein
MKVKVSCFDGPCIEVSLTNSQSYEELVKEISKTLGVSEEYFALFHNHRRLGKGSVLGSADGHSEISVSLVDLRKYPEIGFPTGEWQIPFDLRRFRTQSLRVRYPELALGPSHVTRMPLRAIIRNIGSECTDPYSIEPQILLPVRSYYAKETQEISQEMSGQLEEKEFERQMQVRPESDFIKFRSEISSDHEAAIHRLCALGFDREFVLYWFFQKYCNEMATMRLLMAFDAENLDQSGSGSRPASAQDYR